MISQAKTICSKEKHFYTEIKKLRSLFYDSGYPNWFLGEVLNKFHHFHTTQNDDVSAIEKFVWFDVTLVGKPSY